MGLVQSLVRQLSRLFECEPEPGTVAAEGNRRTAEIAVAEALGDAVRVGLLSRQQGEKAGRMILHDNPAGLYHFRVTSNEWESLRLAS